MSTKSHAAQLQAGLKVFASFLVFFSTWGPILSYGVFEQYYKQSLLQDSSASTISWIGTLSMFFLLLCGVVTGPLYDRGFNKILSIGGVTLVLLGFFTLSASTTLYQIFLSQGACFGLGAGFLYVPSLASLSKEFKQKRSVAIGLAMSGASIGGIVFTVMFDNLIPQVGFGWTVRIMAFVQLLTLSLALLMLLTEIPAKSARARSLVDWSAFTDGPFMLVSIGGFLVMVAFFLPFVYVSIFAASVGAGSKLQIYLVAIINAASFFGRIIPTWVADRFGAFETMIVAQTMASVVLFCWIAVDSSAGFVVWCVVWGFLSGLLIVMPGAVLPHLCPSMEVIGTRMGMAWTIAAIGVLIGGPIGGAIIDDKSSFLGLQVLAGLCMLLGSILCFIARLWLKTKHHGKEGEAK